MFTLKLIRDEFDNKDLKVNYRKAARAVILYEGKLLMVKTSLGDYKFPGGGVGRFEDEKYALYREIKEETGYINVTIGPCIGTVYEQNLDNFEDNAMFTMDSKYFLCTLNSLDQVEQKLEDYEKRMNFSGEFISLPEAYQSNEALMNQYQDEKIEGLGMRANDWLDRETMVLKTMNESIVDRMLWDVFECGQIMKNADRTSVKIDGKEGHANFVTNYDKKIQDELKDRLLKIYEGAIFVGEEGEGARSIQDGLALIVDPIDGTTNFMKDYKMSCISVGMTMDGVQIGGLVYQPYADEMYWAEKGKGAYLNGEPIHVSDCDLEHSLVVFGTAPYYEELKEKSFTSAKEMLKYCIDVRRSGSAALDLCSVAAGRADVFFEYRICPWDIAAGSIIVEEAGGCVSTIDGKPIDLENKCSILAKNSGVGALNSIFCNSSSGN